jgi:hypothetical protein
MRLSFNSGDVTVNYKATAFPVGGIVGGWATGAAFYLGRIEDCVYAGDLRPTATGVRSGGIAGAIGGNGGDAANNANTSRILRCRTAVTITTASMATYSGGIVGNVSNGALVAFSSSDVTVTKGVGGGAGGIAGLLNAEARISDCWSRVIVTGGIATGGVAGFPGSSFGTLGRCYTLVDQTELWVYPASEITGSLAAGAGTHLEDEKPAQWFYEVTYGWDFEEVWTMGEDGYPRLRGVDEGY